MVWLTGGLYDLVIFFQKKYDLVVYYKTQYKGLAHEYHLELAEQCFGS
jgi:hypothetical protein